MSPHPHPLLLPVVALVLLTACSSSEQDTTTMATPESTGSAAPSTPPAPPNSPAPAASASTDTPQGAAIPAATITIEDFDYAVPPTVPVGAQMQVVNNDREAHTVTIPGGPSIVVPPRGATMTFSAPAEAGTYDIVCDFHGNMTAQLVVA